MVNTPSFTGYFSCKIWLVTYRAAHAFDVIFFSWFLPILRNIGAKGDSKACGDSDSHVSPTTSSPYGIPLLFKHSAAIVPILPGTLQRYASPGCISLLIVFFILLFALRYGNKPI